MGITEPVSTSRFNHPSETLQLGAKRLETLRSLLNNAPNGIRVDNAQHVVNSTYSLLSLENNELLNLAITYGIINRFDGYWFAAAPYSFGKTATHDLNRFWNNVAWACQQRWESQYTMRYQTPVHVYNDFYRQNETEESRPQPSGFESNVRSLYAYGDASTWKAADYSLAMIVAGATAIDPLSLEAESPERIYSTYHLHINGEPLILGTNQFQTTDETLFGHIYPGIIGAHTRMGFRGKGLYSYYTGTDNKDYVITELTNLPNYPQPNIESLTTFVEDWEPTNNEQLLVSTLTKGTAQPTHCSLTRAFQTEQNLLDKVIPLLEEKIRAGRERVAHRLENDASFLSKQLNKIEAVRLSISAYCRVFGVVDQSHLLSNEQHIKWLIHVLRELKTVESVRELYQHFDYGHEVLKQSIAQVFNSFMSLEQVTAYQHMCQVNSQLEQLAHDLANMPLVTRHAPISSSPITPRDSIFDYATLFAQVQIISKKLTEGEERHTELMETLSAQSTMLQGIAQLIPGFQLQVPQNNAIWDPRLMRGRRDRRVDAQEEYAAHTLGCN